MARHYYLELKQDDKVVKRKATSLAAEFKDRKFLEMNQTSNQNIEFVVSSEKEKVIN